jgi:hypothetical protein
VKEGYVIGWEKVTNLEIESNGRHRIYILNRA